MYGRKSGIQSGSKGAISAVIKKIIIINALSSKQPRNTLRELN